MRAYAQIAPTFWTRGSGRKLRGNMPAQILALYLMTAPSSNLVGLYYLPLTTICHETGLTEEQVRDTVAMPAFAEIARYDFEAEVVWLPECARYQIGEAMGERDKRRAAVERELSVFEGHPFAEQFRDRYGSGFGLRVVSRTKGHPQTQDTPPKGLPSDRKPPFPDLVPDPVPDPDPDPDPANDQPSSPVASGLEPSLEAKSTLWLEDPMRASFVAPQPWTWREFLEVVAHAKNVFPGFRIEVRNEKHPGVRAFLGRCADGCTVADMCLALDGASKTEFIAKNVEHQTFQTIFRDAGQIDKFQRVARAQASGATSDDVAARRARAAEVEARAKAAAAESRARNAAAAARLKGGAAS